MLLAPLATAGVAIAENYGFQLPSQNPGYLQVTDLTSEQEIRAAVWLVPVVLGFLLIVLGRLGTSNAPRMSYASGLLSWSAIATLLALGGVVAAAVPTIGQIAVGFAPQFMPQDDTNGLAQRLGLVVAVALLPIAELWFIIGLGRIGVALRDARLAGRGSRLLIYLGLLAMLAVVWYFAWSMFQQDIQTFCQENINPQWDKLAEHKPAVAAGLLGFAGLLVWLWYIRLVGATRRAIREWLDTNAPLA
jgi:hypothetical protein